MHQHPIKVFSQAWIILIACLIFPVFTKAQMVTGERIPGYQSVFGLAETQKAKDFTIEEIRSTPPANVLWPGEQPELAFRFVNKSDKAIDTEAHWELIPYGTKSKPNDIWEPDLFSLGKPTSIPVRVQAPPKGSVELIVHPQLPEHFGSSALILDMGVQGRAFAATLARVPQPAPERVQFPTYALDMPWPHEISTQTYKLFQRLGVKGCRHGVGYFPTTSPDFKQRWDELARQLREMQEHNITAMITIGEGGAPMPLGRPRPWLSDDGTMREIPQADYVWLPEYDEDFEKWCRLLASEFGWPKGPVNAVELWNEPWEAVSISGWAADIPRFREIYEHMARGIEAGRQDGGTQVLIGGACSSTNTRDKLFPDGTDKFLKWLDFVSIHYQALGADPALEPQWMTRKSPFGPVRVWDTESWIANSEDRLAGVIASMRSQGQSRTAGIYGGNVYEMQWNHDLKNQSVSVVQTWSPAVAVATVQQFIGQREFRQILFTNGLPWIYVFDGLKSNDDGTLVVLGDLGAVYERDRTLFRGVGSLKKSNSTNGAPAKSEVIQDAALTLSDSKGEFILYDFYGNALASTNGKITIPLNGLGYFLRTTGKKGSFKKLLAAVEKAHITGYEPIAFEAMDFTQRPAAKAKFKLKLSNILNRPLKGKLHVTLDHCELATPNQTLEFKPHESRILSIELLTANVREDNSYALQAQFDAGTDGNCEHKELLHANVTVRKTIRVDGQLDDWQNALPLSIGGEGIQASLTETAWLPFNKVDNNAKSGFSIGYTAYDNDYFYFAAKVVDTTPYEGGPRFENRDDDSYFYPDKVFTPEKDGHKELVWPQGVRRFSYRKDFEIPSGVGNADNIQIAFNILPPDKKPLYSHPKGTMPHYMVYADTDYEFVFNSVADKFGGGVETWCLHKPGMPRKHFFPRQPKSKIDGGPVKDAKLVMRREGNLRIVEAALPWSANPEVKQCLDSGKTYKFTFRINDNHGPANELAAGRSVSKLNSLTFHCDWQTHWANELEFGFEQ